MTQQGLKVDTRKKLTEWRKRGETGDSKWMSDKDYSAMSSQDRRGWSFEKRERDNPNYVEPAVAKGFESGKAKMARGGLLVRPDGTPWREGYQDRLPTSLKVQTQGYYQQQDAAARQKAYEDFKRANPTREPYDYEKAAWESPADRTPTSYDDELGTWGGPKVTAAGSALPIEPDVKGAAQGYATAGDSPVNIRPEGVGQGDISSDYYTDAGQTQFFDDDPGVSTEEYGSRAEEFRRQQDVRKAEAFKSQQEQERERRQGDFEAATDTSFNLGTGNVMGQLTGDLQSQLSAFGVLEGDMRPSYNFQSMGNPTSAREANMFLSQAISSAANSVSTANIDPQRLTMAQSTMTDTSIDLATRDAAKEYYLAAQAGGEIFLHRGKMLNPSNPEDSELIDSFKKIRNGKAAAQNLIENYRVQRQDMLMRSAQTQNDIALVQATQQYKTEADMLILDMNQKFDKVEYEPKYASAEAVAGTYAGATKFAATEAAGATKAAATTAKEARVTAAGMDLFAATAGATADYAGQTVGGKEAQELERIRQEGGMGTARLTTGGESMYQFDKDGNPVYVKDRFGDDTDERMLKDKTVRAREAEELVSLQAMEARAASMEAAGYNIAAIKEQGYNDIRTAAARLREIKDQAIWQMRAEMGKVERQNEGQIAAMNLQREVDLELMETSNRWQSEEANLNRALQLGQMNEVTRASQAKEQLEQDRLALEKEQFNASYILNVAQNPALLYHMKESGLLSAFGETIMGTPIVDMIEDLTASIDPGNLPNIQTYNAMSEQQQSMQRYSAAAGYGLDEGRFSEYITSTSPYTRGRQSTVRVGSA